MTPTARPRMRARLAVGAFTAAVVLLGGACSSGGAPPDPNSAGAQIFTANCARCHGSDATGQIGPNLREARTEKQVRTAVADGVGGRMPSFKDELTPDQIDTVAAYIARIGRPASPAADRRGDS